MTVKNSEIENGKDNTLEASFSVLAMSIASSAAMAMGLAPNPDSKSQKDLKMAKFNIDLLIMLSEKTKNNLTTEELHFMNSIIADLQLKFVQTLNNKN